MTQVINAVEIHDHVKEMPFSEIVKAVEDWPYQGSAKLIYLGNLCARGDYKGLADFFRTHNEAENKYLLNTKCYEFYYGTLLHIVLFWNTGNAAIDLFNLLVEHGAEFKRDYYGCLPWTQHGELWIEPFGNTILGVRNQGEFEETYNYFNDHY